MGLFKALRAADIHFENRLSGYILLVGAETAI